MTTISSRNAWFTHTLIPLIFILLCPPFVFVFWYTNTQLEGSLLNFWHLLLQDGPLAVLSKIWFPNFFGTPTAWKLLAIFAGIELGLMRLLPGKRIEGPITPTGYVPTYKSNGLSSFLVTMALFMLSAHVFHFFPASILYDNFGGILGALNLFSLLFCLFLLIKGRYFPSGKDSGTTGSLLFDYYWGTELYPILFGWNVKQFTNCRFGMMSWPLLLWSFAAKQYDLSGFLSDSMIVAVALQLLYITKFFIWEPGYLRSIDIMHDRAGYYICWGCLVWVPGIYTASTLYLVQHPNQLGWWPAGLLFVVGAASILINFAADRQRQLVRATNGECLIWGKKPELTLARYRTVQGESKVNVLLTSGWWGLARHFHYIPEIIGSLCWCLPALFENYLPYFYVFPYLTILLFNRAYRDEERCVEKYGDDWKMYCEKVPYKIIPYIL